jgi:hypothetical protein
LSGLWISESFSNLNYISSVFFWLALSFNKKYTLTVAVGIGLDFTGKLNSVTNLNIGKSYFFEECVNNNA